jgi:threonine dehydrogenase-like Zn-dependent dehydrogenase
MKALVFNGDLRYVPDHPVPRQTDNDALVRVRIAGICNTDLEIIKGYMGFTGIPGHEFAGMVEESPDPALKGARVVGEINAGCGKCPFCEGGMQNHCRQRNVLGILGRNGAFAEYLTLPVRNLHRLPDSVSDEEAVFVEPLAAAFEITEQIKIDADDRVCVLGDGKLGLLVAQVLAATGCDLVVVGHHREKLSVLEESGIRTRLRASFRGQEYDIVVDCTGSRSGVETAMEIVRPRGTIIMKTTVAKRGGIDLNRMVVNEITVMGSRCGPFEPAIKAIASRQIDLLPLITGIYSIEDGLTAFKRAAMKDSIKVLLRMD